MPKSSSTPAKPYLSTDHVNPSSDNFLTAVADRQAENARARAQRISKRTKKVRIALAVFATMSMAAMLLAFSFAAQRVSNAAPRIKLEASHTAIDVPVTSQITGTGVVSLDTFGSVLKTQDNGSAGVRLDSPTYASVVGLDHGGEIVAMALVPPGMGDSPTEILVSGASTALALVAMHPGVMSSDLGTHIDNISVAIRTSEFAELADLVDGRTPIGSLVPQRAAVLDKIVEQVAEVRVPVAPRCNNKPVSADQLIAEGLALCKEAEGSPEEGSAGQFINTTDKWFLVFDDSDQVCAAIPPSVIKPPEKSLQSIKTLIETAVMPTQTEDSPPWPLSNAVVGSLWSPSSCGSLPRVGHDSGLLPELAQVIIGFDSFANDAVPLARIFGGAADPEHISEIDLSLLEAVSERVQVGLSDIAPAGRLRYAFNFVQSDRISKPLGVEIEEDSTFGTDALLEILVERYR